MRLIENMETFIRARKPHIATNADTDKRIVDDSFAAMEAAKAGLKGGRPNLWAAVLRSKVTRLAAAAMIIVVIGILIHGVSRKQTDGQTVPAPAKSPAEMMTAMSLNIAYRKGGLEAVEKQCDKAFKMLGLQPTRISARELLEEFSSEEVERKES